MIFKKIIAALVVMGALAAYAPSAYAICSGAGCVCVGNDKIRVCSNKSNQ